MFVAYGKWLNRILFFEGLYLQKIKTLKTSILNTRKMKSLMEEEILSGTN